MIEHTCGTVVPATVDDFVRHLAACTETGDRLGPVARQIVEHVDRLAAMDETQPVSLDVSPAVSRDTSETPAEMSASRMAELRDAGTSYRDIARLARVAPETVRRRLRKHETGSES